MTTASTRLVNLLLGAALVGTALLAGGCASPTDSALRFAQSQAMERTEAIGTVFRHLVLYRGGVRHDPLHVYLEHDGTPWIAGTRVADDPTPRRPLALRLMAKDGAAVLYVGRPCHFGYAGDPRCAPPIWTHRRYAEEVVDSLAAAVEGEARRRGHRRLVLIGHSGGGTLATLIARRLPPEVVEAVVTVGANLDVAAWARHHAYSPLSGSLDPADGSPLPGRTRVVHLIGDEDEVVPLPTLARYRARHPDAAVVVLPGYDHECCWESRWQEILREQGIP